MQPAKMFPPGFVDPICEMSPLVDRESKVDVEGSRVAVFEELSRKVKPENEPAMPTLPMRSKSTRGGVANATWRRRSRERDARENVEKNGDGELV